MVFIQSDKENIWLIPIADLHTGHKNFMKDLCEFHVKWCEEDPDRYTILVGDLVESSIKKSPGLYDQTIFIEKQLEYIIELFEPLANNNQILGSVTGNHEHRIYKATGFDIGKYIAKELKYSARNYNPLNVCIKSAKDIFVTDINNKKYYDFLSGYSAVNQGHCHPRLINTVKNQINNVTLTSRAFNNNKYGNLCEYLCNTFGIYSK